MTPRTPTTLRNDQAPIGLSDGSMYSNGAYLAANATWHQEDSPFKVKQLLHAIAKLGIEFRTVAEVGCGAGGICRQVAAAFPLAKVVGYEPSNDAFAMCDSAGLNNLRFVNAELTGTDNVYDLLLCFDVIEHVEDYLGFVRTIADRGQFVVFNIPLEVHVLNVLLRRFERSRSSVGHLHYFTRETALATLKDAGLQVVYEVLTPGGIELARRWDQKLLLLPRKLLSLFSPAFASRLLGGFSLLVVAKRDVHGHGK